MSDIVKQLTVLKSDIDKSLAQLRYDELSSRLHELQQLSQQNDFWQNQNEAQQTTQKISKISGKISPWQSLLERANDLLEMAKLNDKSLEQELQKQTEKLNLDYDQLKKQLLFSGPYDDHSAIVSIYAGAGGTDAQDWADMLLRMYSRWAESKKTYKAKLLNISPGEEAGIKSAELEVNGVDAYGWLKGEHGVHRLVRLSPFNADNLRQTSFARVEVLPKIDHPQDVEIDEKDLKIDVYRSGGKGGQSVNTTDSAVRITHVPTGITAAIQNERSQLQNKEIAMMIIRSKLAQLQLEQHQNQLKDLKGPNEQAAWGNQIRSYVLHPYNMVKDLRTKCETSDTKAVLAGQIDEFLQSYLENTNS